MSPPKSAEASLIEADSGEASNDSGVEDVDSIYSDGDAGSMTQTLASQWTKYTYKHGRRYSADTTEGQLVPNDETQQDQMDLMHEVYTKAKGEFFWSPIGENPQRILDVGTGTGIWAMRVADEYPSAQVVGSDISPIQPTWIPPNCSFEVDDFNKTWQYTPNSFDLVHARALHAQVKDWKQFCKDAFHVLNPGGWLEICGEVSEVLCDDAPVKEVLTDWIKYAREACDKFGPPLVIQDLMNDATKDAGFDMSTFTQKFVKMPIGTWPKDKKMKELGAYLLVGVLQGLEGYLMVLHTQGLGWTVERTQEHMDKVKAALKNKKNHTYLRYHCTYVQKPMTGS